MKIDTFYLSDAQWKILPYRDDNKEHVIFERTLTDAELSEMGVISSAGKHLLIADELVD